MDNEISKKNNINITDKIIYLVKFDHTGLSRNKTNKIFIFKYMKTGKVK